MTLPDPVAITADYIIATDPDGVEHRYSDGETVALADFWTATKHLHALWDEGAIGPVGAGALATAPPILETEPPAPEPEPEPPVEVASEPEPSAGPPAESEAPV